MDLLGRVFSDQPPLIRERGLMKSYFSGVAVPASPSLSRAALWRGAQTKVLQTTVVQCLNLCLILVTSLTNNLLTMFNSCYNI